MITKHYATVSKSIWHSVQLSNDITEIVMFCATTQENTDRKTDFILKQSKNIHPELHRRQHRNIQVQWMNRVTTEDTNTWASSTKSTAPAFSRQKNPFLTQFSVSVSENEMLSFHFWKWNVFEEVGLEILFFNLNMIGINCRPSKQNSAFPFEIN